jgi:uncharacterized surface protein with fasciclin (FAS1) repeats
MTEQKIAAKILFLQVLLVIFTACEDKFDNMENHAPEWLGENVYDYLKNRGDCNYYVRLIDDCGYTEVMQRTGSNTLFFSNDGAFERFFQNNAQEIESYEQIPQSMKYTLLRLGMLDNAYLIDRLGVNERGAVVFRRTTYLNVLDTIPQVSYEDLPQNSYFSRFNGRQIRLLQDDSQWTLTQFFHTVMNAKKITDDDFNFITGENREENDAFIFNSKIIRQNITCKNGYLHELEELLLPPENMAGFIRSNSEVSKFNHLMERFAVPHYTRNSIDPESGDTIFALRYFNNSPVNPYTTDPDGNRPEGYLYYDPGWNRYQATANSATQAAYETDMATMFVPTNEAMDNYFAPGGAGEDLYLAFGGIWDSVPSSIVADIVANHQKYSFMASLPSRFSTMKDEAGYEMDITKNDIVDSYLARNGLVYLIDRVLPPLDYRSVMGPFKIDVNTKIFNLSMGDTYCQFQYYLRSLKNNYLFFVTPDIDMIEYLDPVSLGYTSDKRATWKFRTNVSGAINATVYSTQTGDSIGEITSAEIIKNRLNDILDQHTVVGFYNPEQEWYLTKSGAPIRLAGTSAGSQVAGVGNLEQGKPAAITKVYEKNNGTTFYVNGLLQNATTSIYRELYNHPEFSEFFNLCNYAGFFEPVLTAAARALDNRVTFFDLYRYTIFVPTNQALREAIHAGLIPDPDAIEAQTDQEIKDEMLEKLVRIMRYHFVDNSVYIKGEECEEKEFLTATINQRTNKFYPVWITNKNQQISLKTAGSRTNNTNSVAASVIRSGNLYNLPARDIVVNNGDLTRATMIETSSWAVIHQIDKVLWFE